MIWSGTVLVLILLPSHTFTRCLSNRFLGWTISHHDVVLTQSFSSSRCKSFPDIFSRLIVHGIIKSSYCDLSIPQWSSWVLYVLRGILKREERDIRGVRCHPLHLLADLCCNPIRAREIQMKCLSLLFLCPSKKQYVSIILSRGRGEDRPQLLYWLSLIYKRCGTSLHSQREEGTDCNREKEWGEMG